VPSLGLHSFGHWTPHQRDQSINWRELEAVRLGLLALHAELSTRIPASTEHRPTHVRLESDNMTTVFYINKLGGRVGPLNNIVRDIHLH